MPSSTSYRGAAVSQIDPTAFAAEHEHVFLGVGHDANERKTWAVIALCSVMMVVEIVGGSIFGSLALVADGLHMSTHASAMLIAALAYTYARKHARDRRFVFGTGKLGDLAGFSSAIILAMIALLIGYEAVARFLAPVPIRFAEAIPIAVVGLGVNIASAWLLRDDHHHGHSHGGGPGHGHDDEQGHEHGHDHDHDHDHAHAHARAAAQHEHDAHEHHVDARDHNLRAAYVHVIADAAVSVLAIVGLLLARTFGWIWMDPVAGIVGDLVIANWAFGLVRDTGAILLDINPSASLETRVRDVITGAGDRLIDLHVWRLGPGHYGAVVSVITAAADRGPAFYHSVLGEFAGLSHITVEVHRPE
jgi:cation diffusion facilitator family transporter